MKGKTVLSRSILVIHGPKDPNGKKKRVDSSFLKGLDHSMAGQIWDKMVLYYSGLHRSGQTVKK